MNNQLNYENNNSSNKAEEIVNKMIQLIARMEEEGNAYVQLRSKLRSQLTTVNHGNGNNPSNDDNKGPNPNNDEDDNSGLMIFKKRY